MLRGRRGQAVRGAGRKRTGRVDIRKREQDVWRGRGPPRGNAVSKALEDGEHEVTLMCPWPGAAAGAEDTRELG